MSPAPYDLDLDLADAVLYTAERVGLVELSLWYCESYRCFVIVLGDETVLSVFADDDNGDAASRYYADVLEGLRHAQALV